MIDLDIKTEQYLRQLIHATHCNDDEAIKVFKC